MGAGPITFSYPAWVALFPELFGVTEPQAELYFGIATTYVRNDGCGPINDPVQLTNILNLTTAHVARLLSTQVNGAPTTSGTNGTTAGNGASPPSGLVGRISSAAEGSVNVATDMGNQPASAAWWIQTEYGFMAWQMLKPFRNFRYVPAPRRLYNPPVWRGGLGRGWY